MHKIQIHDSVVAGAMQQRGKLNRYDQDRRAADRAGGDRSAKRVHAAGRARSKCRRRAKSFPTSIGSPPRRASAGGKVVWVQMTLNDQEDSWSVFFEGERRREAFKEMQRGSHGHALHRDLDVKADDLVIEKRRYSAFIQGSSNIDQILRGFGIDTVLITGTLTNVCCESSARDAMMLNYKIVFVSDANAALSDAEHNASLGTILRVFGDVATTDETISRLVAKRDFSVAAE